MKCDDCIFGKVIAGEIVKCQNPYSEKYDLVLHKKQDGCLKGRSSTIGINALQQRHLMMR